jgi:hypothetical protein
MFRPPRHRGAERRRSGSAGPCSFGRRQPRHVARDGRRALSQRLMGFGLLSRRILFLARTSWARSWRSVRRSRASRSVTSSSASLRARSPSTPRPARTSSSTSPKASPSNKPQSLGVSGLTALRALDIADVAAGWRVLVVGGRVGTYAVRIAVALGVDQIGGATDLGAVVATPSAEVDAWTLAVSSQSR